MSNGKFYDIGWHTVFKSGKKKSYQETCIYLNDHRECENSHSPYYMSKCFDSTHCPLKIKNTKKSLTMNNAQTNVTTTHKAQSNNKSILLYNKDDKQQIELFMNGRASKDLPKLHQEAFKFKINDEFEFAERHYKVIKIYENKTFDKSFRVVSQNKIKKKVHNTINNEKENTKISNGDIVTLYCCDDNDIIEFKIGENYDIQLEKACIGHNINDSFLLLGQKYIIQYVCKKEVMKN